MSANTELVFSYLELRSGLYSTCWRSRQEPFSDVQRIPRRGLADQCRYFMLEGFFGFCDLSRRKTDAPGRYSHYCVGCTPSRVDTPWVGWLGTKPCALHCVLWGFQQITHRQCWLELTSRCLLELRVLSRRDLPSTGIWWPSDFPHSVVAPLDMQ